MLFDDNNFFHSNPINAALPLREEWRSLLNSGCIAELNAAVRTIEGKRYYPKKDWILRSLNELAPNDVNVIILGQDPYYSPNGQAIGRAFACGVTLSPSLRQIFNCLSITFGGRERDLELSYLVKQGVLLLNTTLTVEPERPNSHLFVWADFTKQLLKQLLQYKSTIVLIAWGEYAKKLAKSLNHKYVLTDIHPASAERNGVEWFSLCFVEANQILSKLNKAEIKW